MGKTIDELKRGMKTLFDKNVVLEEKLRGAEAEICRLRDELRKARLSEYPKIHSYNPYGMPDIEMMSKVMAQLMDSTKPTHLHPETIVGKPREFSDFLRVTSHGILSPDAFESIRRDIEIAKINSNTMVAAPILTEEEFNSLAKSVDKDTHEKMEDLANKTIYEGLMDLYKYKEDEDVT